MRSRVPRALHPVAWWVWAIGLATAASRTTNPVLLVLVLAVLAFVIANRRTDAPWARAFKYYLAMALVVIVIRVVFRSVFAGAVSTGDHILFTLPQLHAPSWYSGIRLGTLLCCVGAANALANPKRALRVLPGALYELGVAVIVAVTFAPQLVESVQRVRRARRLRPSAGKGTRALRGVVVPVLEDALERSLRLAAAMDSRGYGRTGNASRHGRRLTGALLLAGMVGLCLGVYGLLAGATPSYLGLPVLLCGGGLCAAGLAAGGRRVARTTYRPDPWGMPEWIVAGSGIASAVLLFLSTGVLVIGSAGTVAAQLSPSFQPLQWPAVPLVPVFAIVLAAVAGIASPVPPRPMQPRPTTSVPEPAATREKVAA